ncbi:hypothetical protein A2U01_0098031, partial [Trifolium medium]|nr:hypothetical protein [Trifolium medium]
LAKRAQSEVKASQVSKSKIPQKQQFTLPDVARSKRKISLSEQAQLKTDVSENPLLKKGSSLSEEHISR